MNRIERNILALALAGLMMAAQAAPLAVNRCISSDASPLYGDNPDQCKDGSLGKLKADRSPQNAAAAPTAREQESLKKDAERKQAECARRRKDQFERDFALQERYPSEDDLQEARYRDLGDPIRGTNEANERLKVLIAKGRDFAEKVKFFEPPHQMPEELRKNRDLNRELERIEFQRISGFAHDILRINEQYDAQLKRYRELVNGTAQTSCDPNNE